MRLCLASLHPRILSGQIDSLAGLARGLVRAGHEVEVVVPFDGGPLLSRELTELDDGPRGLWRAARVMLRAIPQIVHAARGCDLVHVALPTPAFGALGDVLQAASGVPTVVGFEGHLATSRELVSAARRGALATYLPLWGVNNHLVGRVGVRGARAYVVSSRFQADELAGLGYPTDRVVAIPNLVEQTKLAVCNPRLARRRLGLPPQAPLVGYVGHFNDVKGVDVLAQAFGALRARRPDATLALAWSGQGHEAPIRRALADHADHVVWLSKVKIGTFLCAIDALALPYRSTAGQGAYPSLVLEAIQTGCPLVTTDLPLLEEITSLGDVAATCPTESPEPLADALDGLLGDPVRRAEMVETQRRVAARHLTPDVLLPRYEALYASVLGHRQAVEAAA